MTIAWFTNRKIPKLGWFIDSLTRQLDRPVMLIAVDFYRNEPGRLEYLLSESELYDPKKINLQHVAPMPNVWNGPHRLTKKDHFNAASARNTAICLCRDPVMAFADDLSVVKPGWWQAVMGASTRNRVTLGCYQKVMQMQVKAGEITSCVEHQGGIDHRIALLPYKDRPSPAYSTWFFGCSFVAPIDTLLKVGGFCEALAGGMGYEDCAMSQMLTNCGEKFLIDPRMMTVESEELHSQPGQYFARLDPCKGDPNAVPRDDKSHALLRAVQNLRFHPNHYGPEGLASLRRQILAGEPWPIPKIPEHCWFSGQRLSEME